MERHVLKGLKRFGQFLQSERPRFAAAPVLLIQGKDTHREPTDMACRHVEFILAKQLGFRTVMSHSCSDIGAFATTSLMQEQHELVARTGATTVCAVGNQAAMDLAKAIVLSSHEGYCNELILVPATYEGTLACSLPHSLLLDTVEDALLVESSFLSSSKIPTTVAILEAPNYVDTSGQANALFASISLGLDVLYRNKKSRKNANDDISLESRVIDLLTKTVDILERHDNLNDDNKNSNNHDALMECILLAGDLASFGISMDSGRDRRSIPLGVAASLMPRVFPNEDILTVMASLVPTLCHALTTTTTSNNSISRSIIGHGNNKGTALDLIARINAMDKKPKSLVTTEPIGSLISLVDENRLLWNCFDASDDDYAELLRNHVIV